MSQTRSERLEQLFDLALDLEGSARVAFLDEKCGTDSDLRARLDELLGHDSSARESFLSPRFVDEPASGGVLRSGHVIGGHYTLQRLLGEGGMGVVWLAQQHNPRRDVALKLIRPGLAGRQVLRRFEIEAAVLGLLQHAGVAQIYEAGLYDDGSGGRPFFAMEFVDGLPLKEYVRARASGMSERLELFASICDAVHHAHQKGVVHRDLKPGNILVTPAGQPKVLDFGVARATDSDLQVTTLHTDTGQLIGTLPYMSPEQVGGRGDHLDTRSDVYSLGVILYELLTDRLPHDVGGKSIPVACRIIAEDEPAPMSAIDRSLRGDLDTIALKALEKDPDRRYSSASDLAADVRRFLRNEPIVARAASTMYHFRKFARRNKALVVGVAVALVLLLAGIAGTTYGMFEARGQRDNAERQGRITQAVNDFFNNDLLSQANPYIRPGAEAKLRDVLNDAAKKIEGRFQDEPEIEASIRLTLGKTYFGLADFKAAAPHFSRAAELFQRQGKAVDWLHARLMLATTLLMDWQVDAAEPVALENVKLMADHFGTISPEAAESHGTLGIYWKRRGRYPDAESEYRTAIDVFGQLEKSGRLQEDFQRKRIIAKNNLALVLRDQKKLQDAEAVLRGVVDDWVALRGRRHPDTAYGLNNLGDVVWNRASPPAGSNEFDRERLAEAETLFREAYDIRREMLGENHPETYASLYGIGCIEIDSGRFEKGEETMRQVLAFREKTLDPLNRDVLSVMNTIGAALKRQNRPADAAELFAEALRRARQGNFDPEHPDARLFRNNLLGELRKLNDRQRMRDVYLDYFDWLGKSLDSEAMKAPAAWARRANALAWRLVTCEIEDIRDRQRGLDLATQADERAPNDPKILDTLAAALAANDRIDEAIQAQQRALSVLPKDASAAEVKAMQDSIESYKKRLKTGDS